MDEPTSSMDPISRKHINENIVLNKNKNENNTIFYCTHIIDEAEFVSDRVGIMINGKIRVLGDSIEIKNRYGNEYMLWITFDIDDEFNVCLSNQEDIQINNADLDLLFENLDIKDDNVDAKLQFNSTKVKVKIVDN